MTRRAGKTLIETLVLITLLAVAVGMSTTSLATLFRIHRLIRADAEQAASLARLATQFRRDAHEAISVSTDDRCVLTLADGRMIHYVHEAPRIVRQVRRGDAVLHRDRFSLAKSAAVSFEREGDANSSLVRLSIVPREIVPPKREIPRAATIEAAVGLHRKLAQNARQP
jgi:type II secretory pathway component PulJ